MTTIEVQANKRGVKINPAMWGIFFEDINFGADGGLYAELVKNRGFEFPDPLMGWHKLSPSKARGQISIRSDDPFNARQPALPAHRIRRHRCVRRCQRGFSRHRREGRRNLSILRSESGTSPARRFARRTLLGGDGALLILGAAGRLSAGWKKRTAVLRPNDTDAKARLTSASGGPGCGGHRFRLAVSRKHVEKASRRSCAPTWCRRWPTCARASCAFPAAASSKAAILDKRYQWKKTIGPIEERPLLINRWNYEFLHRPTPDYFQSFGLGFFEYFQLCEDIGAEPLPILNCGMACQFNSGELVPLDELGPLHPGRARPDRICQRSGDEQWGAKRAAMGHPAAVQHENARHRQRTVGAAIHRAAAAVHQGDKGEASRNPAYRVLRAACRTTSVSITCGRSSAN